jgi:hypothetical protein
MITEIGSSLGSIMVKKIINDTLPKLDIKRIFKNSIHVKKNQTYLDNKMYKLMFLLPIARFYEMPDFEIEESTMNKKLVDAYFNVLIKLLREFDFGNQRSIKYHAGNLNVSNAENKDQILGSVLREKKYPTRNDSRYRMGFRSIYTLLYDNIDKIDAFYIMEINSMLKPFFNAYNHKELLIPGLELN